jgi:hypothetical protein
MKQERKIWVIFFSFWWYWGLNAEFCACKTGTLPFEPHLQSILLWLFWRRGLMNYFPTWPQVSILLISASQVARIRATNHWHSALGQVLKDLSVSSVKNFLHPKDNQKQRKVFK